MGTKRMQVLMEAEELRQYRKVARNRGVTLAEWVRTTLRTAVRSEPLGGVEQKLAAVRSAVRHEFPAPDVERMNAEIERGYLDEKLG